ncbi:MAG: ComEC/Rec2 family competence protein [Alphaproteobacteria bacterium]
MAEPSAPIDEWAEADGRTGYDHGRLERALAALRDWLSAERDRWILWLPVLVGVGVLVYFSLPAEPPYWPGFAAAGGLLFAALVLRRRHFLALALAGLGLVALGFGVACLRTGMVAAPVLEARIGPTRVVGTVLEADAVARDQKLVLGDLDIAGLPANAAPERVRVTVRSPPADGGEIKAGARVELRAVLSPPPEPTSPGAWDFGRQAYFERLGGFGFALGGATVVEPATELGMAGALRRLRETVSRRFIQGLPGENGALAAALLIGDRSAMPESLMEAMRDSGLAHLIAISGLNFSLVASFVFVALRAGLALVPAIALRYPIKKWAAAAALIAAFGYLLLSGVSVPTQRAFLMVALVLVAIMLDRTSLSMRFLMWAALIVLLIAPEAVLGASFQMSFGATMALIAAYEAIRRPLGRLSAHVPLWQRPAVYLLAVAFTSLIGGIATGPFALYHFNRFADYGLVANLAAVPLTGLWVMPWGVVALLLMPFGAEGLALVPMSLGLDGIAATARMVAGWHGAVTLVPAMPPSALALVVAGMLWLCLWRRRARLLGLAPIAAAVVVWAVARPPDLLIDGGARLFAARADDGELWLSSRRTARFVGDSWLRRAGREEAGAWPLDAVDTAAAEGANEAAAVRDPHCDSEACVFTIQGRAVSVVLGRGALLDECGRADVLVALMPLRLRCPAPVLRIDRFDLWRHGTHALWIEPGGVVVETVGQVRGERPWAPPRKSARQRAEERAAAAGEADGSAQ